MVNDMSENIKNKQAIKRLKNQIPPEFVQWLKDLPLENQTREIEVAERNLGLLISESNNPRPS